MADAVAAGDAGESGRESESETEVSAGSDVEAEAESGTEVEVEGIAESVAEAEAEAEAESAVAAESAGNEPPEPESAAEPPSEAAREPESGPGAAATQIITPAPSAASPEPATGPRQPAEPASATSAAKATAVAATPSAAVPSASFVPPAFSAPPRPVATTVRIAGREFDRRAALIAGGVGVLAIGGLVAAFASAGGSSPSAAPAGRTGAGTGPKGSAGAGPATGGKASTAPSVPLPIITTVPADGASGVDPSKPVTVRVLNGTIASVQLSGQDQTNGTLSTDETTWTSANALSVDSAYQLTITAKNAAGRSTSSAVSFHTLQPSATFGVSSVVPPRGSTVGVGQPIRVTFSNYVPTEYHAALEQACVVTCDPPVAGAWYWVSNSVDGAVLDWRPRDFWAVGTKVSIAFNLNGVRLGRHQFGVKNYAAHDFAIRDTDLRLIVDKDRFTATCYRNGKVIRTFPIDTGQTIKETFVTYTGTMAVLGKGNPVEMKGDYGPNDTYDDFVNWATQITWSGTYVHAAPWDSEIGHANDDSHGCVHCRTVDAEWFYNLAQPGDVVVVNGSRERPVDVGNGICTFTLGWADLLKGSAYGATRNGKPVSG